MTALIIYSVFVSNDSSPFDDAHLLEGWQTTLNLKPDKDAKVELLLETLEDVCDKERIAIIYGTAHMNNKIIYSPSFGMCWRPPSPLL